MIILAIETSCDETAISILKISGGLRNPTFEILSNIVASQIKIHSQWGGIVPSLAKREHQANLIPVLKKALKKPGLLISNSKFLISNQIPNPKLKKINSILNREPELLKKFLRFLEEQQKPSIDVIAVTQGPGLEPALWVGINFAKALAVAWNKPLVAVNHMEGHIYSVLLSQNRKSKIQISNDKQSSKSKVQNIQFPAIALLASGGHTQLVLMNPPAGGWLNYKIIGETLDDAAGECFDKVARMLGLGYPGGPQIAQLAQSARKNAEQTRKNAEILPRVSVSSPRNSAGKFNFIEFPRPMINSKDYNFSFSGLKTAVLYKLKEIQRKSASGQRESADAAYIAASFQQAVIDVLIHKTIKAAKNYKAKTIILGGGVAANKELRKQLKLSVKKELPDSLLLLPEIKFTGDNAAMIALAAYIKAGQKNPACRQGRFANLSKLKADGNLKLYREYSK